LDKGPGDEEASIAALRARLMGHLQELVRERDPDHAPAGHSYVKNYLARELERYGKAHAPWI
jgi:hypothetical protein